MLLARRVPAPAPLRASWILGVTERANGPQPRQLIPDDDYRTHDGLMIGQHLPIPPRWVAP